MFLKRLKLLWRVLKDTGEYKTLLGFVVFFFVDSAFIWILDPEVNSYNDALWYCYAVFSTIGFGDVVVGGLVAKLLSVLLTIYSIIAIAIITGVVVHYYTQMAAIRNKETLSAIMDKLENLSELSKEELKDISKRVKVFRKL